MSSGGFLGMGEKLFAIPWPALTLDTDRHCFVIDADKGMTRRAMLNNHLGFPEGVTGPDLVERGQQQAEKAGAEWVQGEVTGLERKDDGFALTTEDGRTRSTEFSAINAHGACVVAFSDALLEGREFVPSGIDGLRSVQVTDAMARSAHQGVHVRLAY